jgi:beta-mannosidase
METQTIFYPEVGPIAALVPGSVQTALRAADLLDDWNIGLQSRGASWVEHLQWEFRSRLRSGLVADGESIVLCADGLDHSGWILIDSEVIAEFCGTLEAHRFDLTAHLTTGKDSVLRIIFDCPPAEQGQIGYTSKSRHFKPRFSYEWDWCPRFVPIGIWDSIALEINRPRVEELRVDTSLSSDFLTGHLNLQFEAESSGTVRIVIAFDGTIVREVHDSFGVGRKQIEVEMVGPRLWWPNGEGDPNLYDVQATFTRSDNSWEAHEAWRVGFKSIVWKPCRGAPREALPWICEVNGRAIFLQGVNWTPVQMDYPATRPDDYETLINLYARMGCNILRVWGGAFLEKREFYDRCDEAGLMVWQEFPLSSSGIENRTPDDPLVIERLTSIAAGYVRRRSHHASLCMWCGGNELQQEKANSSAPAIPLSEADPCLAALARTVRDFDPGHRMVPTSPSGPRFFGSSEEVGRGLHHDVHGPWHLEGGTLDNWRTYWALDDALLRSEMGMPGAAHPETIRKYAGGLAVWPPDRRNPYWRHSAAWWTDLSGTSYDPKHDDIEDFAQRSQALQAEALSIAVRACRDRFPSCGGVLIWMGHDAFPCPINTSLIDYERRPKAAYHALAEIFHSPLHREIPAESSAVTLE